MFTVIVTKTDIGQEAIVVLSVEARIIARKCSNDLVTLIKVDSLVLARQIQDNIRTNGYKGVL